RARQCLSAYSNMEELIKIGAYRSGADPIVDRAIALNPMLEDFLRQDKEDVTRLADSFDRLESILNMGMLEA
ncbi:ATP synthase, partial [Brevundimonas sp. GN22]